MTTPLLFIDTETTGLSLDDDIWEFAAIRREPDGTQTEHHMFIQHDDRKCAKLPESFREDHDRRWDGLGRGVSQAEAAKRIHDLTADRPHIVGAVPNFDTERIALLLRAHGLEPGWHYHLIDVEPLAVGYLHGHAAGRTAATEGEVRGVPPLVACSLPWRSDDLSRALGVEPPGDGERHTALGDARWAMAIYDAVMSEGDTP